MINTFTITTKRSSESKKVAITGSNSQLVGLSTELDLQFFFYRFFFCVCKNKKKEQLCFWSRLKANFSACV